MWSFLVLAAIAANPLSVDRNQVDRGTVKIGPPLSQSFQLNNHGPHPIVITDVGSTCGCLAPKLDRRELPPGGRAQLTIEVNTLSQPAGPIRWTTRVNYRHGEECKSLDLDVRAHLISEIKVEPAAVAFNIRQTRSVDVVVHDTRPKPFRITGVGTSLSNVKAEVLGNKDQRHHIRLTATTDGPAGVQSAFAWFTTDDPAYPQIKIPVTVNVPAKQRIVASPSVIDISAGESARVIVSDQDGFPVAIETSTVDGPLTCANISKYPGAAIISVRCGKDAAPCDATLRISIREPVRQVIAIPIVVR